MANFYLYFGAGAALLGWFYLNFNLQKRILHILQLEDYEPNRMLRSYLQRKADIDLVGFELVGMIIIILTSFSASCPAGFLQRTDFFSTDYIGAILPAVGLLLAAVGFGLRGLKANRKLMQSKKKLVLTNRAKRILAAGQIISLIIMVIILYLLLSRFSVNLNLAACTSVPFLLCLAMYVTEWLAPLWLSGAVLALQPVEKSIQNSYIKEAKQILQEFNPLVIGITGSYGKTGTKEILSAMLSEEYNVFKPPGSYNTLMGVTRIIRERLRHYHEIFVAEMGAYRIGSIKKLCDLTKPKHGIITIIGMQHLERFKTQDNIQKAKGELVEALPPDGIAVLNGDDPRCREIGKMHSGDVVYFRVESEDGLDENDVPAVIAKNIKLGVNGSEFTLLFSGGGGSPLPPLERGVLAAALSKEGKEKIAPAPFKGNILKLAPPLSKGGRGDPIELDVFLPLLGRPAIANATAAAAMAHRLGTPLKKIKRALKSIPQVEHRLEYKQGDGGVNIIDDAFNSNPIGAKSALEVLARATGGRRILVTPGMVELGELEEQANYEFGKQAAGSCDLAVLIGVQRVQPIKRGLIDGGFDENAIWVVPSLKEGLDKLKAYLKTGDTILLENDLPDQYAGK